MAQYSRHPVAPPPTAPEREKTGHLMLRAYATLVMLVALGYPAVFNLLGATGAVVTLGVFTIATVAVWVPRLVRGTQPLEWRRMPWAALAYVGFALASLAWSRWPGATMITWLLLASVTLQGLFLAHSLSWRELLRSLSHALQWLLGLSIGIELWVSVVLRHPILPNFITLPDGKPDPHLYWVRDNLIDGGRIQGIVGNSITLAILCVLALIVFCVLFAVRARHRLLLAAWIALTAFLLLRASSATAYSCVAAVGLVLCAALLTRLTRTPRQRTVVYASFLVAAVAVGTTAWLLREQLLGLLGRESDLTGRVGIWQQVLERWALSPVFGNGYSTPWVPWDPGFMKWQILDHGVAVFHAHNMWVDTLMQLGVVGAAVVAIAFIAFAWRAWFFAVDRPRWDRRDDRPYSARTLLPILVVTLLLVQGLSESAPLMMWGWMMVVALSFRMKTAPVVVGADDSVKRAS